MGILEVDNDDDDADKPDGIDENIIRDVNVDDKDVGDDDGSEDGVEGKGVPDIDGTVVDAAAVAVDSDDITNVEVSREEFLRKRSYSDIDGIEEAPAGEDNSTVGGEYEGER